MEIDIMYRPSYSMAMLKLAGSEQVRVEAGSLVSMTDGVQIATGTAGGLFKALGRSMFAGESFFQNIYTAPGNGGVIGVAPALPGDMFAVEINNTPLMVQSYSFVACEIGVELETKWSGAKTFFSSEGAIMMRAFNRGKMVLSSYGAIHEVDLKAGEKITVDTGHLVAFSEGIGYKVRPVGGLKSTLFSGEGLVVDLTGPGKLLLQSRSTGQFLAWLIPQLPSKSSSGG